MAKFRRYEGYVMNVPQKFIDNNLPICPFCHSNQPHWLLASKMGMWGNRTLYRCERCGATMSSDAMDAAAEGGRQFGLNAAAAGLNAARKGSKGQVVGIAYLKVEELGTVCTNTALLNNEYPLPEMQAMAGIVPAAPPVNGVPVPPAPQAPQPAPVVPPVQQAPVASPVPPVPQHVPQSAPVAPPVQQAPVASPVPPVPQYVPVAPPVQQVPMTPSVPQYVPQPAPVAPPVQQAPVQPISEPIPEPVPQPVPQPVAEKAPATKKVSLVTPILAAVFALLAFLCGYLSRPLLVNGLPVGAMIVIISILRIGFSIPALVLGIIGLIRSIKGKKIVGIIIAGIALVVTIYVFYLLITSITNYNAFRYFSF